MEALTKLKGIGRDIVAWCPGCKHDIIEVELLFDLHPYNRDYAYCPDCKTGIIRSDPRAN